MSDLRPASIVGLVSAFLLVACGGQEDHCADITVSDPRQADLACLARFIETEQSWPDGARRQAEERLAVLESEAADLDEASFYVRSAAIVALADNGHTAISKSAVRSSFGLLPIRTYWFEDGLFVVRATREHQDLLGTRVLEIAGRTPDALMAIMKAYYGGPDEDFRVYGHSTWFLSPPLLHAVGLTRSAHSVPLVVQTPSGDRVDVELATWASSEPAPGGYPWRQVHPDPVTGEGDGWVSWLGEAGTRSAWAFDDTEQIFRYRFLEAPGVAHVQFRANTDAGDVKIADFLRTLEQHLEADRPRHIVWDQRLNSGGDLTRTADFALQLHEYLPEEGHVYVLTSNATFSAGIYSAFLPEWANDGRTTVVGTRVGDRERFWAESDGPMTLPGSGWRIYYSLQLHDLGKGCFDLPICHIRHLDRSRWDVAVGSFDPDQRIPERSVDFLAGRDAVVEWVLSEIGSGVPSPLASSQP